MSSFPRPGITMSLFSSVFISSSPLLPKTISGPNSVFTINFSSSLFLRATSTLTPAGPYTALGSLIVCLILFTSPVPTLRSPVDFSWVESSEKYSPLLILIDLSLLALSSESVISAIVEGLFVEVVSATSTVLGPIDWNFRFWFFPDPFTIKMSSPISKSCMSTFVLFDDRYNDPNSSFGFSRPMMSANFCWLAAFSANACFLFSLASFTESPMLTADIINPAVGKDLSALLAPLMAEGYLWANLVKFFWAFAGTFMAPSAATSWAVSIPSIPKPIASLHAELISAWCCCSISSVRSGYISLQISSIFSWMTSIARWSTSRSIFPDVGRST